LLACAGRRRKRRERVCTGRGVEEGGKNECANVQRRSERAGESIAGGVRREEKRREEKRREEKRREEKRREEKRREEKRREEKKMKVEVSHFSREERVGISVIGHL
jgi:CDP-4-dehydro-6-deoxyglucose reductase, E1